MSHINMLRYLFALKVNTSLGRCVNHPSVELSLILQTIIAERMPTNIARPWLKAMNCWKEWGGMKGLGKKKEIRHLPENPWPIEAVLFFYPGKRAYGFGELVFWELKLMGEAADHGFFLEVILPAIEELGSIPDKRWCYPNSLWGAFDIHSIFVANGNAWDPLAESGGLNLEYYPTPVQWAKENGSSTGNLPSRHIIRWITSFNLGEDVFIENERKTVDFRRIPSLTEIMNAFADRIRMLTCGANSELDDFLSQMDEEEKESLLLSLEQAASTHILQDDIQTVFKDCPGRFMGYQTFSGPLPPSVIPYLKLASLFHIGRHTHFGCGTFMLDS